MFQKREVTLHHGCPAMCKRSSFIHKFMNLCSNGKNANLSLQCNDGRVTIDLQLHLYHPPPPPYYQTPPPRPHPQPCQQGVSPSRLRRSKRRAHARAEKARSDVPDIANNFDATENAATFTNPNKNTTEEAEQAVVSFLTNRTYNILKPTQLNKLTYRKIISMLQKPPSLLKTCLKKILPKNNPKT